MIRPLTSGTRSRTLLALLAISIMLPSTPAAAQDEIRFQGRVSWIAGETMVVSTDDTPSVRVDLKHVDQSEYQRLTMGDHALVIGTIADDANRVLATSIEPLAP
jgi:uncharacterized protein YdbL (DUF1318 family)